MLVQLQSGGSYEHVQQSWPFTTGHLAPPCVGQVMAHRSGAGSRVGAVAGQGDAQQEGSEGTQDTRHVSQGNLFEGDGAWNGNRLEVRSMGFQSGGTVFEEASLGSLGFNRGSSRGYLKEGRFYSGGASTSSRQQQSNKKEETVDGSNKKEVETFGSNKEEEEMTGSNSESGRKEDWQDALLSAVGRRPRNDS